MPARTYAYSVDVRPLDALWEAGDADELVRRLAQCDEEVGIEGAELRPLVERALAGQPLDPEAQNLLDETLAVFIGECLSGEPLTDVDFFSGAYEELAEVLSERGRLSPWETRAVLTWGLGRGWREDLPVFGAGRRAGGYFRRDELPRVRAAFVAAERTLRGPEREAYRPLVEEALTALDEAIRAGCDLALCLA
ncbi:MAG TPA: hypothetical protein DEP84_16605 [Chloroflexi bacterium]|nr:hypothetical protein [Chloroflexota bacterium]